MSATIRQLSGLPDLLSLHHRFPNQWPYLLASTATSGGLARWSILLRATGDCLRLNFRDLSRRPEFLVELEHWHLKEGRQVGEQRELPFAGGWFVYLGYELAGQIEPGLNLSPSGDGLPVAVAHRCTAAVMIDHSENRAWLSAESGADLSRIERELTDARDHRFQAPPDPGRLDLQADDGEIFKAGVETIRDYIRAGDVFQVNLSRGWHGRTTTPVSPAALFSRLARSNAAPFAGLARFDEGAILSSSPERLVEIRGQQVQTRPIAGTRPRGQDAQADSGLSRELIAHPKERAEHIMLIDLERNDLGRVCKTGSVEVNELMVIESYAHVHHIVSNVRGLLREGASPSDVIAAVFPGGTITGCPKVRCMEIIAELEPAGRSFYTGAMGYLDRSGDLDLNILIRSMCLQEDRIHFRTGAGIVVDSDPAAELVETEDKALGMLMAVGHE